jgi:hypothetical protein
VACQVGQVGPQRGGAGRQGRPAFALAPAGEVSQVRPVGTAGVGRPGSHGEESLLLGERFLLFPLLSALQGSREADRQRFRAQDRQSLGVAHGSSVQDGVASMRRRDERSRASQQLGSSCQPGASSVQPPASTKSTQHTPSGRTAER